MAPVDVDEFDRAIECTFDGEKYSVRDNGAVLRHPSGKRKRALDGEWTFGKENTSNPYLLIAQVRVHRIVATAFHGDPPEKKFVVDHIDTNCRNNRPENLRWLSRLDNALKNPVTRKNVEHLCGSVESFLENPSMLNEVRGEPNFKWMRAVSKDDARNCLARMEVWANSEAKPAKRPLPASGRRSFERRVYRCLSNWEVGLAEREPGLGVAETPWCAQHMWLGPGQFPCCPSVFGEDRIDDYLRELKPGLVFARSDDEYFFLELTVLKAVIHRERSSILVMGEESRGAGVIARNGALSPSPADLT